MDTFKSAASPLSSANEVVLSGSKKQNSRLNASRTTTLFLILVLVGLFASGHAKLTSFQDCMKNPFAANCRGISAKRSIPQQTNNNFELTPSQQDLWRWQPDSGGFRSQQQAISHRSQQPQNTLLYQLLLPIPALNINYRSLQGQQQQQQLNNNLNNNNAFEILAEG